MDYRDQETLRKNHIAIISDLDPEHILDYLYQEFVFTEDDCERIRAGVTRKDRAVSLVDRLKLRGPDAYTVFRSALQQNGYQWMVDILDQGAEGTPGSERRNPNLENCQKHVKNLYKNNAHSFQPLPWDERFILDIKDIYTTLHIVGDHKASEASINDLNHVFTHDSSFPLKRILIEGKAGMGKSTSVAKILNDWAEDRIPALKKYKVIFSIELRQIQSKQELHTVIFDQLLDKYGPVSEEGVKQLFRSNSNEIAFILDGFDEFDTTKCKDIMNLIHGKLLPDSLVLLTSRPNHCDTLYKYMSRRLDIRGFTFHNMMTFVKKYFQLKEKPVEKFLEQLRAVKFSTSLIQIPLFALFLCVIWEENPDETLPNTVTELYSQIITCLRQRFCDREGLDFDENVEKFYNFFGKVALKALLDDKLFISSSDIQKQCYDIRILQCGIVVKERCLTRLSKAYFYQFLHKTFQEYFAAHRVKDMLISDNTSDKDTSAGMIISEFLHHHKHHQYFFLFLSGLLGPQSSSLWSHFRELMAENQHDHKILVCQCLRESGNLDSVDLLNDIFEDRCIDFLEGVNTGVFQKLDLNVLPSVLLYAQNTNYLHRLVFDDLSMPLDSISALAHALPVLTNLKELSMAYCFLTSAHAKVLSDVQAAKLNIEVLKLRFNTLGAGNLKSLDDFLEKLPNLTYLDMSHCKITDEDCQVFEEVFPSLTKLKFFKLRHNMISEIGASYLSMALSHVRNLEVLDVSINRIDDDGAINLAAGLENLRSMKVVSMSANDIDDAGMINIANSITKMTKLGVLDVTHNPFQISGFIALARALRYTPNLKVFRTGNYYPARCHESDIIHQGKFERCIKTISILEPAHFENYIMNRPVPEDRGPITLGTSLKTMLNLEELTLCTCRIGSTGIQRILNGILDQVAHLEHTADISLKSLTVLNLHGNMIGTRGGTDIGKFITYLPNLQVLDLCNNRKVTADTLYALQHCKNLTKLMLINTELSPQLCGVLGRSLPGLMNLEELDISDNVQIQSQGIGLLAAGFSKLANFKALNVEGCSIGDAGVEHLHKSLMPSLEALFLGDEQWYYEDAKLTDGCVGFLKKLLERCSNMKLLSLVNPELSSSMVDSLMTSVVQVQGCKLLLKVDKYPRGCKTRPQLQIRTSYVDSETVDAWID